MEAQRIDKPWGYELLWAHTPHYAGKILAIRRGCQLSLQLHERKDECLYLLSGALELELEGDDGNTTCLRAIRGETFHIPPRRRHRLRALTTCRVLEVSTPELDDVVRLQDDYGRAPGVRPILVPSETSDHREQVAIGQRMRAAAIQAGIGASGIAQRLGVKPPTIYRWWAGERAPSSRRLAAYAAVVQQPMHCFFQKQPGAMAPLEEAPP